MEYVHAYDDEMDVPAIAESNPSPTCILFLLIGIVIDWMSGGTEIRVEGESGGLKEQSHHLWNMKMQCERILGMDINASDCGTYI
jgi:hypothetical protein